MDEVISDEEVRQNIADNVNELLEDRGWSQSHLSRVTGVSQQAISLICAAERVCGAGILARFAEAFGVPTDRLIYAPKKSLARAR